MTNPVPLRQNLKASDLSIEALDREIKRREAWSEELARAQMQMEDELAAKKERHGIVAVLLQDENEDAALKKEHCALEASLRELERGIKLMVAAISNNSSSLSKIVTFKTAKLIVEAGFPVGIIGASLSID